MEPCTSFTNNIQLAAAKRIESHETSQKRFEENTSKNLLIDNCPASAPPCCPPSSMPKPCKPSPCKPKPEACCPRPVGIVCPPIQPICFPKYTAEPPTVSVQWKPISCEMQCLPNNTGCTTATVSTSPCSGTIQGTNCGGVSQYTFTECTDWESNLVSHTDKRGNSKVLVSEDSEKYYLKLTCKDSKGISNSYYKGSDRKSTTVCCEKGKDGKKPCKDCVKKCESSCEPDNGVRYLTKVKFNPC